MIGKRSSLEQKERVLLVSLVVIAILFTIGIMNELGLNQGITGAEVLTIPEVDNVTINQTEEIVSEIPALNESKSSIIDDTENEQQAISILAGNLPITNLGSPSNNTFNYTNNTIRFTFNVSDHLSTTFDCSLWLNYTVTGITSPYGRNNSVLNATSTIIWTNTSLIDGGYWWWINCTGVGGTNVSEKRNITVAYVDHCGVTLTKNITFPANSIVQGSAGTECFKVAASGITIDGRGTTIQSNHSAKTLPSYLFNVISDNVTIKNFKFQNARRGIYSNAGDSLFINLSFDGLLWDALLLQNAYRNNFTNLTILNSGSGISGDGIDAYGCSDNIFKDIFMDQNTRAIYMRLDDNTEFINANITYTEQPVAIETCASDLCKIYFINSSVNLSDVTLVGDVRLYNQHYVYVNITNSSGDPIQNANVSGYDVLGDMDYSVFTDLNGIARLILSEYYIDENIRYYITSNHTVRAFKNNYLENQTETDLYNVTGGLANITLDNLVCGMNVSVNAYVGSDYYCTDSWINIKGNNITITGNNYTIYGLATSSAIIGENVVGILVDNLNINNFTIGLNLSNSTSASFTNVNITNCTTGAYFLNSDNTIIKHSFVDNSSGSAAYANAGSHIFSNSTINLNNVTIQSSGKISKGWVVKVNVTFNNGVALPNTNVYTFFNDTNEIDDYGVTGSDGLITLDLVEDSKNISGLTNRKVHNITVNFSSLSGVVSNSSIENITTNMILNYSLTLNCTVPTDNLYINNDTLLCPGTHGNKDQNLDGIIIINSSNITLTCDNTILQPSTSYIGGKGIQAFNLSNITITGCTINNYRYGIYFQNINNSLINDSSLQSTLYGITLFNSHNNNITFNTLNNNDYDSLTLTAKSSNNMFYNNSFYSSGKGVNFDHGNSLDNSIYESMTNNTFYYNNFTSNDYDVYKSWPGSSFSSDPNSFNYTINISGVLTNVGNVWSYICTGDVNLTDNNNDGWYDSGSNYPYNLTLYNSYHPGVDYYPKVISCSASTVFLSSSSSSSSSSSEAGQSAAAAEAEGVAEASVVAEPQQDVSAAVSGNSLIIENPYDYELTLTLKYDTGTSEYADDLAEYYRQQGLSEEEIAEKVKLNLLADEQGQTSIYGRYYSLADFSGVVPTGSSASGRLFKSIFPDSEEITIPPGGKFEKTLEVESNLVVKPKKLKVTFTYEGQTVEKELTVTSKKATGTAVDIDSENKVFDLYLVIPPIDPDSNSDDTYWLEFDINEIGNEAENQITGMTIANESVGSSTIFSDMYGPYSVARNEGVMFGQEFAYSEEIYSGNYVMATKVMRDGEVVSEHSFVVEMGGEKVDKESLYLLIFVIGTIVFLLILHLVMFVKRGPRLKQKFYPLHYLRKKVPLLNKKWER